MNAAAEKGANREDDGGSLERDPCDGHDAANLPIVDNEVGGLLLKERQIRLVLEDAADGLPVELPIRLRPRGADRGALTGVQRAELDSGQIRGPRHRAAQCVDLAYQMPLADTADGRVAAHLAQGLDALSEQQRPRAHAGSRQRSFGAGMATTDHDDVKGL